MLHPRNANGTGSRWSALLAAALAGYALGAAHTARLRHQLAAARHAAVHDPLTGLPNRHAALVHLRWRLSARRPTLVTLLDLDDFKSVNDRHGHLVGDALLTIVAARLHVAVPPHGLAARLGGDEFLTLLPDGGGDPARAVAPILELLSQPVRLPTTTLRPRASAGVTTSRPCRHSGAAGWRQLLTQADRALYRTKHTGIDVAVYDPQLDGYIPQTPPRPGIRRRDRHPGATRPHPRPK